MKTSYNLHPSMNNGRLIGFLLYIYDGQEGQRFWETMILPDDKHIRALVPGMENVLDIDPVAKHRRSWAHKFAITLQVA